MNEKKMTPQVYEQVCSNLEYSHRGIDFLSRKLNSTGSAFFKFKDERGTKADRTKRGERYMRARKKQLDWLEDMLIEVSFDGSKDNEVIGKVNIGGNRIQRDRLKVDTIKFVLGKLRANLYGENGGRDGEERQEQRVFNIPYDKD